MFGLQYRALMASEIPDELDCRRLAASGKSLEGTIRVASFDRFDGNYRIVGDTQVSLHAVQDAGGKLTLTGSFVAPMQAQCQRCMQTMTLTLKGEFELQLVDSESEAENEDDAVYAPDGRLTPRLVIEDEILLAVPMIPLHNNSDCHPGEQSASDTEQRQRPFAGLDQLIKNSESND